MQTETFVEMELKGPADQALGFVVGFRAAQENPGPVWVAGLENVDVEGFLHELRTRLNMERHIIVGKEQAQAMAAAIGASNILDLEVGLVREIVRAELAFEAKCYSKKEADAIRRVLEDDLPEGVRLEGYDVKETVREDAKGVELYGPVHDYVCEVTGRYVGPVPGVIEMARRLDGQDFIHPKKVDLIYAS
ncbi:MAG: hypothetical protein GXP47_09755 [Acidobacteria bacterium]|nr:hypothetical protein [Acidobacteriota bacterium]